MSEKLEQEILKKEEEILKKETEAVQELKQAEQEIKDTERRMVVTVVGILVMIALAVGGLVYWKFISGRIQIDKASISATKIDLAPSVSGVLQEVDVKEGDIVLPDTVVARVDNQEIKTKVRGLVIAVNENIGTRFNPGEAVVSIIDPNDLRVVGQLEEDKGLKDVRVGQQAIFTVDTFGSRQFYGTVDEISPTSRTSDVVFSISDKRQMQVFDIKIRYNLEQYPELKNGMSAKISILK